MSSREAVSGPYRVKLEQADKLSISNSHLTLWLELHWVDFVSYEPIWNYSVQYTFVSFNIIYQYCIIYSYWTLFWVQYESSYCPRRAAPRINNWSYCTRKSPITVLLTIHCRKRPLTTKYDIAVLYNRPINNDIGRQMVNNILYTDFGITILILLCKYMYIPSVLEPITRHHVRMQDPKNMAFSVKSQQ